MKDSKEALIIFNLGSPFEYWTFKFAVVRPKEKMENMLGELLFDLVTYSDLKLLETEIENPIQLYIDEDVREKAASELFELSENDDIIVLKSR